MTDAEVSEFSGSAQLRRLKSPIYDAVKVPKRLRNHLESMTECQPKSFGVVTTDPITNISTIQVHFNTWDQAKRVHDSLDKQRFPFIGDTSFQLRLPEPFQYLITIPSQQYCAQRKRWDLLLEGTKDKGECNMTTNAKDNACVIRVMGRDRKAVGLLKARVEDLVAGETLESWHPSLGANTLFLVSIFKTTRAFVRIDWKNRALKLFGEPSCVDAARTMLISEIHRLESLEYTVFLKRQSVKFFMDHGVAALKEALGNENVTLDLTPPCKITIKGAESAKHTLNRLIQESLDDLHITRGTESSCPVCYDEITAPVRLACGHSYCTMCVRHFLASVSTTRVFPVCCVGEEGKCGVPIHIPAIQRYLLPEQFTKLLDTAFITHIEHNPQDFKYCTTPDCNQVYRCGGSAVSQILHCPSCLSSICSSCQEEAHEGMTCAERRIISDPVEQERLNDELALQQGFKKCVPSAWSGLRRIDGCNHMSCRCGAHICWVCMGTFESSAIYGHLETVHGGNI